MLSNGWITFAIIVGGACLMLLLVKLTEKPVVDTEEQKSPLFVCTECLTAGRKITVRKGSFSLQLMLYLVGFIPGLAYHIWRESTTKEVCPSCGKDSMIPVDTPKGRQLMIDIES